MFSILKPITIQRYSEGTTAIKITWCRRQRFRPRTKTL